MQEESRIGCIDGIKAIATILVFNIHFLNAYYHGIYTLNPADFHTKSGIEWWIGGTPLNFIYAGKLGARVFLVLSAFLLTFHFFKKKEKTYLITTPVKKYVRLVFPILTVNLIVYFLMQAGAYSNQKAALLVGSQEFFGVYNQFTPSILSAIKEAVAGCFLWGSNAYNGPLWFIQYEFIGCCLVAFLLYVIGRRKWLWRIGTYIFFAILLIRTDYLCMILGMALADIICAPETEKILQKIVSRQWLLWALLGIGLYFGTYPSYGNAEGTIYALFPPKVLFYLNVAIPVILFAVFHLKPVRFFLEQKFWSRFTRISYCFYLVHFPMLATLSAAFFVSMYGKLNYHLLVLMTYCLTFLASAMLAWGMTRCIEKPGRKLADKMEELLR